VYFQLQASVGFLCIVKGFFVHFKWGAFHVPNGRDSERSNQQNPGHDGLRERELHHAQCPQNDASYKATGQQGTSVLTASKMGVSENSGAPKWMVYNGKPYSNG